MSTQTHRSGETLRETCSSSRDGVWCLHSSLGLDIDSSFYSKIGGSKLGVQSYSKIGNETRVYIKQRKVEVAQERESTLPASLFPSLLLHPVHSAF